LILVDEPSEGLASIMVEEIGEIHPLKQSSNSILLTGRISSNWGYPVNFSP
jgi:ABC-type branched-subunit amino acid transport system ATPase component